MDTFIEIMGMFLIFGSILFLAYVTTRYIGARSRKVIRGRYIEVIDTIGLGMDKQLYLIRVDRQFVLVAASGKNLELLTKVEIEDYDFESSRNNDARNTEFKNFFEKYTRFYRDRQLNSFAVKEQDRTNLNKEAYSIKTSLEKLKSISKKASMKDEKDGNEHTNEE